MNADVKKPPGLSKRRRKLPLLAIVLLLVLLPFIFASQIIEYLLPRFLESQGHGIQMTLSEADVELLKRRIRLVDVRLGPGKGIALHFQEIAGRVNLKALLAGEFPLQELQIQGGELDVEVMQQIPFNGQLDSDTKSDSGSGTNAGTQSLKIPDLQLNDFKIKRLSAWLKRDVIITRLNLKGLETPAQNITGDSLTTQRLRSHIELQLRVGDGTVNLEGELGLRGEIVNGDIRLLVENLDLNVFEKLLGGNHQPSITGLLNSDTHLQLEYNPNNKMLESQLSGAINTVDLKYQDSNLSAAVNGKYTGELSFDAGLEDDQTKFQTKFNSQGLFEIANLNLSQAEGNDQAWSLETVDLRYEGIVQFSENFKVKGDTQSTQARLRLNSDPQDIILKNLAVGIDFNDDPEATALAVLTALKVDELNYDNSAITAGKSLGQKLSAEKIALNQDLNASIEGLFVESFVMPGGPEQAAVKLAEIQLKQLLIAAQGDLTISDGGAKNVEVNASSGPITLSDISLTGFNRTALGVMTLKGFKAQQLNLDVAKEALQAQGISIADVQQRSDNEYLASTLEVESLDSDIGLKLAAKGVSLSSVVVDTRTAINAATLATRQFDLGFDTGAIKLSNGQARDFKYGFEGLLDFAQLRGDEFGYEQSSNIRTIVQGPVLKDLSLNFDAESYRVGSLSIASLLTQQTSPTARLASGSMEIQSFVLNNEVGTQVGKIKAVDLNLGTADPPQISLPQFEVLTFKLKQGQGLSLASVVLQGPKIKLEQSPSGVFNNPKLPFVVDDPKADSTPFWIRIQKLKTQGKPRFTFTDKQVKPVYVLNITPFQFELDEFNTRPGRPAGHYKFTGQTNKFTNLEVSGTTKAIKQGMNIGLTGQLTGLALKNLTPYTGTYENFAISKGQGDLTLSGYIRGNELDLKTKVVISKLELEPFYQGSSANPAEEDGSGSLRLALKLLSDDNKTVKMKVPITGTLEEPDLDFSDATGQAVAGVAKGAVMLAFQPLGVLVSVAKLAGNIDSMAVGPVLFSPAQDKLGAESITLLDSLADKLTQLPELKLNLCGRVVKADLEVLAKNSGQDVNAAQLKLAQLRSGVVRDYLEQKKLIAAKQLVIACSELPTQNDDTAKPRTDLSLDTRMIRSSKKTTPTPSTKSSN